MIGSSNPCRSWSKSSECARPLIAMSGRQTQSLCSVERIVGKEWSSKDLVA